MTLRLFSTLLILLFFTLAIEAFDHEYFYLGPEPLIRIGLATNAGSVTITTTDSSLIAACPDEPNKILETNRVSVSARAYKPPEIENFRIEFQNLPSQVDAENLARDIRESTGETALPSIDIATNTWKVWVGSVLDTIEDADALKARLADKGFEDAVVVTEKKIVPSQDAIALSQQLKTSGKSEVRSLLRSTASSGPTAPTDVDPNLREVIISGASETAKYASLKPVAFASTNERVVPVRFNGKPYRGKIEVFVNSRGSLTVVNVVSLEDYLLGVVPRELGLPHLEAEKAQAVAARTYAIANIDNFVNKGFDLLPTVQSQVYGGVSAETQMATQAVLQTRGIIATYKGKPINAMYTSTCGGRTENSENVFDFNEPYLRGVECSLEGHKHFDPFTVKTTRLPAKLHEAGNLELARLMSLFAVNGFQLSTAQITDSWFEETPTESELSNWLNQLAMKFGKPFPNVNRDTAKPAELAHVIAAMIYPPGYADTLLTDSDINYQLIFDDAQEIPKDRRADVAVLLRDGYFAIHPDFTLKPNKPFTRGEMLRLIRQIYEKKKWMPGLQSGTAKASVDGKLVLKSGKSEKQLTVRPDVFLFRRFGSEFYPVREAVLVGGEEVGYHTDSTGAVFYLEVTPTALPTSAENMSPFSNWEKTLTAPAVRSRLSQYVRGLGELLDMRIAKQGYSRRVADLEIVTTNGTFHLTGGKIRSALRLNEQLFVINKRYSGSAVASYTFTGRGWGHGVGMCQYGAYGLAKMGVKYDGILKHYYTGIELTRAY